MQICNAFVHFVFASLTNTCLHFLLYVQEIKYRTERMKKEQAGNDRSANECGGDEELLKILRDIVTFHGEMVLLENYSSLNYTGQKTRDSNECILATVNVKSEIPLDR